MRAKLLCLTLLACATNDEGDGPAGSDTDTDPYAGLPEPAAPPAYSGGDCPALADGVNDGFESGGLDRSFRMHVPKRKEGVGVLFLWHGNGDSAANFDRYLDGEGLARQLKVITIVPEKGAGGLGLDWSVPPNQPKGDATFFEDVLSCLSEQYDVDLRRVYTAGFSAGALWSSWLVMNRADHLAGAVTFSGGADGNVFGVGEVNPYTTPAWEIPVLMTEGGRTDEVLVNFQQMTQAMSGKLRDDGSTVIVCSHNQGHTPYPGFDDFAWDFLGAHVYGAESPYAGGEDPSGAIPTDDCAWE